MKTQTAKLGQVNIRRRTGMVSYHFWILALGCFAAVQFEASAITLYTNDFEGYSNVATNLGDLSDADPASPEWNVLDDTCYNPTNSVAGVQVVNWKSRSGTNSLLLRANTQAHIFLANAKGGMKYTLDFWVHAIRGAGDRNWYVILRGMGSDSNGDDYFAYRTDRAASSNIFYFDGIGPGTAAFIDTGVDHVDNQWQHHRVVFNSISQTCAIYVDNMDTPVVASGELARPDVSVPSLILLQHEGNSSNDGYAFLDDVSFSVDTDIAVTGTRLGGGAFQLDWPRTGALKYRVQRGTTLDNIQDISGDLLTTQFTDANPPAGSAFYRVVGYMDLTTTFSDGFESYPARVSGSDDADPLGPWITVESDGNGSGRLLAPVKVQVVDSNVVTPHSGTNCLKIEAGQRAGASVAWGQTPQTDVEITWWARVPTAVVGPSADAVYLRMSLYGVEGGNSYSGDAALLGYGIRAVVPVVGDATSLTYFTTAWVDTGVDFTPDTWEEYRLTTHNSQGRYTIVKHPGTTPVVVVDRAGDIGGAGSYGPMFMAAWSSSNGTNHPPVYIDDIQIKTLVSNPAPLPDTYTVTNYGTRFTNVTILAVPGSVGKAAVDPRDNSTILYTLDSTSGAIFRAQKTGPGTWTVDPQPVVNLLSQPSGLAVETNGTIWWTHDFTMSLRRLKEPWASSSVEEVISNFGSAATDDDTIDLTFVPGTFSGTLGTSNMLAVADRGSDDDAFNAVYLVDPTTMNLGQTTFTSFLVNPTSTELGSDNLNAITALAQYGEVVTLSQDGRIAAINGDGVVRAIFPATLWQDVFSGGPVPAAAAIATDPTTGRLWIADDTREEIWSVDPNPATQATAPDQKEVSFPLINPGQPNLQLDIHDPGLVFAPNGAFMVLTDTSTVNGGGRLIIFHNETP